MKYIKTIDEFINESQDLSEASHSWKYLDDFINKKTGEPTAIKYWDAYGAGTIAKGWKKHLEKGAKFPSAKAVVMGDMESDSFKVKVKDKDIKIEKLPLKGTNHVWAVQRV